MSCTAYSLQDDTARRLCGPSSHPLSGGFYTDYGPEGHRAQAPYFLIVSLAVDAHRTLPSKFASRRCWAYFLCAAVGRENSINTRGLPDGAEGTGAPLPALTRSGRDTRYCWKASEPQCGASVSPAAPEPASRSVGSDRGIVGGRPPPHPCGRAPLRTLHASRHRAPPTDGMDPSDPLSRLCFARNLPAVVCARAGHKADQNGFTRNRIWWTGFALMWFPPAFTSAADHRHGWPRPVSPLIPRYSGVTALIGPLALAARWVRTGTHAAPQWRATIVFGVSLQTPSTSACVSSQCKR